MRSKRPNLQNILDATLSRIKNDSESQDTLVECSTVSASPLEFPTGILPLTHRTPLTCKLLNQRYQATALGIAADQPLPHAMTLNASLQGTPQGRYSLAPLEPRTSPWTGKILEPFIWRDFNSRPCRYQLLRDIKQKRRDYDLEEMMEIQQEPPFSIDFCHFQECLLDPVNEALSQQFWPGIDVSENLSYPDYSIVALYRRLVIGCAFMMPECYITYIMVRPGWQGCGIGKFMLYYLSRESGRQDMTLHVSANNPAMILYQELGFKPEGFIVNFYDKYLPPNSKECKNALVIRKRR